MCGMLAIAPPSPARSWWRAPFPSRNRASAEAIALGEAARHQAAGGGARAEPIGKVGLGARPDLALAPGQPLGEGEDLGIGKAALAEALQHDAAAAGHLRDLLELADEHLAVVAEK